MNMYLIGVHGFWKDLQIMLQYLFFTFKIYSNFKSIALMNSLLHLCPTIFVNI